MVYRSEAFEPKELLELLEETRRIAIGASRAIMTHYYNYCNDPTYLDVSFKSDNSPVTAADQESHNYIVPALKALTPDIPIISEENKNHPDISGGVFWTVDPLDGTKGFMRKNNHFYVKIALIEDGQPVLGVIYEPVHDRFHYSITGALSYVQQGDQREQPISTRQAPRRGELSTLFNGLHYYKSAYFAARQSLLAKGINVQDLEEADGACKKAFHMAVASGDADIYLDCGREPSLRGGNGYSWDYAPDALILPNAGGVLLEIATGRPPRFDRPTERMNAMIALGDPSIADKLLRPRSFDAS